MVQVLQVVRVLLWVRKVQGLQCRLQVLVILDFLEVQVGLQIL